VQACTPLAIQIPAESGEKSSQLERNDGSKLQPRNESFVHDLSLDWLVWQQSEYIFQEHHLRRVLWWPCSLWFALPLGSSSILCPPQQREYCASTVDLRFALRRACNVEFALRRDSSPTTRNLLDLQSRRQIQIGRRRHRCQKRSLKSSLQPRKAGEAPSQNASPVLWIICKGKSSLLHSASMISPATPVLRP
jgi:hypothetical protein